MFFWKSFQSFIKKTDEIQLDGIHFTEEGNEAAKTVGTKIDLVENLI